jgi:hypothetical protein
MVGSSLVRGGLSRSVRANRSDSSWCSPRPVSARSAGAGRQRQGRKYVRRMNEGRIVESQGMAAGGPPRSPWGVAALVRWRLGSGDDPGDVGILSVGRLPLGFLFVPDVLALGLLSAPFLPSQLFPSLFEGIDPRSHLGEYSAKDPEGTTGRSPSRKAFGPLWCSFRRRASRRARPASGRAATALDSPR